MAGVGAEVRANGKMERELERWGRKEEEVGWIGMHRGRSEKDWSGAAPRMNAWGGRELRMREGRRRFAEGHVSCGSKQQQWQW